MKERRFLLFLSTILGVLLGKSRGEIYITSLVVLRIYIGQYKLTSDALVTSDHRFTYSYVERL